MFNYSDVVKEGTAVYDKAVPYEVRIIQSPIRYGSGDYEDPPEIYEDTLVKCYYVWYESLTEQGSFNAGGGVFPTLAEAMAKAENDTNGTVQWR
ncbi:MAG: hypothetical protein KJ077_12010 [Anaerolineae bacterium]|nr:hypothetical protein [Anaerolineae bacterium]